jgi:acetyltransferase-like isoleucine patch superfamily enzyme
MNDNIRTRDAKTYINEYGWSRDLHSRHFGSGEDVVLEKPVKIRNFKSLINELDALPEDFKNKNVKIYGTPRLTIQDSCGNGFALIRHVINQMVIATGNAITVDEYIECDFSEFMASTASKWHKQETLDIFMIYYTKGKRYKPSDLELRYEDIISFLKIVYEATK